MLAPEEVTLNHVTTSTIVVLLIEVPPDRILYFKLNWTDFLSGDKKGNSKSFVDTMS